MIAPRNTARTALTCNAATDIPPTLTHTRAGVGVLTVRCSGAYHCCMRLWTLHPKHLDTKGLVAVWREALLAQAVLLGRTRGYTRHPQLDRFRACVDPIASIGVYLYCVWREATDRGYSFDVEKIHRTTMLDRRITATDGQLQYEREHLVKKLFDRDREAMHRVPLFVDPHPLFRIVPGDIAHWERS